jgi:hypothetical protein
MIHINDKVVVSFVRFFHWAGLNVQFPCVVFSVSKKFFSSIVMYSSKLAFLILSFATDRRRCFVKTFYSVMKLSINYQWYCRTNHCPNRAIFECKFFTVNVCRNITSNHSFLKKMPEPHMDQEILSVPTRKQNTCCQHFIDRRNISCGPIPTLMQWISWSI